MRDSRATSVVLLLLAFGACQPEPTLPSDPPAPADASGTYRYTAEITGYANNVSGALLSCNIGFVTTDSPTVQLSQVGGALHGSYRKVTSNCTISTNGGTAPYVLPLSAGLLTGGTRVGDTLRFTFDTLSWTHDGYWMCSSTYSCAFSGSVQGSLDLGPPYGVAAFLGSWAIE